MEMSVLVRSRESHSSREGFGCSTFADEGDGTEGSEEVGVFDAIDEIDVCTKKMEPYQFRARGVIGRQSPTYDQEDLLNSRISRSLRRKSEKREPYLRSIRLLDRSEQRRGSLSVCRMIVRDPCCPQSIV